MNRSRSRMWQMVAALLTLAMVAASCGGDTTAAEEAVADVDVEGLTMAIVAPSASDDLAFTQSMVEAVEALGVTPKITDGTFIVEDAAAAIRGYAEEGINIVVAHGTQYGDPLEQIAKDFPDTTFVWGTSADTKGLPNVFAYFPAADEGGYVQGIMAAGISESGRIGVVGPVEAGDAVAYVNGFVNGAVSAGAEAPSVTYTGSFSDVALAKEAAEAHVINGVDVLTGTAQMVVGAVGVATANDIPWFATQANQTPLDPNLVVASQVYHWEVALAEIIELREGGTIGGQVFEIDLANGGLEIEFNDGYDLPSDVRKAAEDAIEGIRDGSISTGVG